MLTTKELDRLTAGWPVADDAADFDLAVFAGSFRDRRPELSAPALDRVADRMRAELDRRESVGRPRPTLRDRAAQPFAGALRLARRAAPYALRTIPLATAASVLLGLGLWLGHRPAVNDRSTRSTASPANAPEAGKLVKQRRPAEDRLAPDGPEFPVP